MARTKRKRNPLVPAVAEEPPKEREYKVGAYVRLSLEDSGKPGADTIETQQALLLAYIERQHDMRLVDVYCDNGRTGTNFERPGFERLMADIRVGKIDCIVVKDLSRFGRNYLESSNYLLRVFPFLGVRFVAINEFFDTETAVQTEYGLVMPLKNIINDTYSRDISRKVASAIATKEQHGEFIGVFAPYGYRKSEDDRHRLEINPETAPVIRDIFSMRLRGMGYGAIARRLNEQKIPSPGAYLFQSGLSNRTAYRDSLWATWNIKEILRNEVYLGHLIQGKRTQESYKQARSERYAPAEEWRISRNTHEPIIDEQAFAAAQELAQNSKRAYEAALGKADDLKTPNLFRNLIYCADCGKPMIRRHIYNRRREGRIYYYSYLCPTTLKMKGACTPKNLMEQTLVGVVLDTIRCHVDAVSELDHRVSEIWDEKTMTMRAALSRQAAEEERKLSRSAVLLEGLYQRLVDGIITKQEYSELKNYYQAQYREAEARHQSIKDQEQMLLRCGPENPMFSACRNHYEIESLTEDLVHSLVDRIEVYDSNRLDIKLVYQDEFLTVAHFLEGVRKP